MKKQKKRIKPLYKFLIVLGFFLIGCIPASYITVYVTNKNDIFDVNNAKISKKPDEFNVDFNILYYTPATIDKKNDDKVVNGKFKLTVTLNNFKEDVKDLKIKYDIDCDWTSCEATSSEYRINSGNPIIADIDPTYKVTHYVTPKTVFPLNPLFCVEIKNPTLYARLTYKVRNRLDAVNQYTEKVVYLKITPDEYLEDIKNTTTKAPATTKAPTTTIQATKKD